MSFVLVQDLRYILDSGKTLGLPDGLLINGRGWNGYTFTVQPGKHKQYNILRYLLWFKVENR